MGAMITVHAAAAPPPSHSARAPLSLVPCRVAAASTGEGMEVVLGHPTPYTLGDISVGEAMSTGSPGPVSSAVCPAPRR
jgi:hypothetical protein